MPREPHTTALVSISSRSRASHTSPQPTPNGRALFAMEMLKLQRRLHSLADIPAPPLDLPTIEQQERDLTWPFFSADHAWFICSGLREILHRFGQHAVISISLSSGKVLAHTATNGTIPDNDVWVSRKRKTVLRWGHSTWYMRQKLKGDERLFREKYAVGGADGVGEYAIHGGGFPIRVKGVEGVVAVVVVSGLKQEQDHMVIVEVLRAALKDEVEVAEMRKKGVVS